MVYWNVLELLMLSDVSTFKIWLWKIYLKSYWIFYHFLSLGIYLKKLPFNLCHLSLTVVWMYAVKEIILHSCSKCWENKKKCGKESLLKMQTAVCERTSTGFPCVIYSLYTNDQITTVLPNYKEWWPMSLGHCHTSHLE